MRCPACGQENPDGFRFCGTCGAALDAVPAVVREERKVVTVLFADLVGFTSRAERMDPEDVRALLAPYHARLREELERFGGTVEKFIGDAVMALFGAPVAHEDDPERAVRAALAIRDWVVEEDDLQLRIAVNTGEALVALGARPEAGEGMASGDVVNTTARLQSGAPVNGILVGETTYRATRRAIDYQDHDPVEGKGKSQPLLVWEAVQARARFGVDVAREPTAPLVGRDRELDRLRDVLATALEERSPQLVTLVGVPGIGKSRLVYELMQSVFARPDLVAWRQGRSLPYGEGVTFWALAEMVKAQLGILESDPEDEAERKLREVVDDLFADAPDAAVVESHLRPLLGLSSDADVSGDRRTDAFAAWRSFFEALAHRRPLVLVFEDLHWADDGVLDFIDHLVDWASGPLLVVCTARPELLERRPGWGGGKLNSTTISVSSLSDEQTAQLLSALLERRLLEAETQQALLTRAGGNPLYAEQYVEMLADRRSDEELPLPESLQGIIAARLDALPGPEKELLQDAAVLGKVFWLGALVADRPRGDVEQRLHALERKGFVQRAHRSSVAGEPEYGFHHLLVRDVAYGQIPRARRGRKHLTSAEWIDSLGRSEDHAEMIAHHTLTALDLARAAGEDTPALAERAARAAGAAGDRALALDAYEVARDFYAKALELARADDLGRPRLLLGEGTAAFHAEQAGEEILAEASAALFAAGDVEGAAEAEAVLAESTWYRGDGEETTAHLRRAAELVEPLQSSRAKAHVLATVGRFLTLADRHDEAIEANRAALAVAVELGLEDVRAQALHYVGLARAKEGDPGGLADMEKSLELAEKVSPVLATRALNNLAAMLYERGDVRRSFELWDENFRRQERLGRLEETRFARGSRATVRLEQGRWDEALQLAEALIAGIETEGSHQYEGGCRRVRGFIRAARGDLAGANDDMLRVVELGRLTGEPQTILPDVGVAACVLADVGSEAAANAALDEWLEVERRAITRPSFGLASAAIAANRLAREGDLAAALDANPNDAWVEPVRAYLGGDFARAASLYASLDQVVLEADARLRAAEALVGQGRRAEADGQLQRALAFYRSVGATRYVREAEALLAAAS
jgi:class 3 adenylate cyclase/tetratricopeptide (TPR) repeat protein